MSRLQELIERYCPDGVEYKALGEIASFGGGHTPSKAVSSNYEADGIWWVTSKDVKSRTLTRTGITLSESGAADLTLYPAGTLVMVTRSGILKRMLPIAILDCPMTVNQDIKAIMPDETKILSRYLLHVLVAEDNTIRQRYGKVGGTVDSVNFNLVKKHRFPVPPIEVQHEIVRLLDAYTAAHDALVDRLNEEIELQAKSLAAYRESLLTFSERERVRWATLGELGTLTRGKGLQKKDFTDSGIGCIHYGQIYMHYGTWTDSTISYVEGAKAKSFTEVLPGDVVVAITSENMEDVGKAVAWIGDEVIVTGGHCCVFRSDMDNRFVSQFFCSRAFAIQKRKIARGVKVIEIAPDKLAKIKIPVPDINEQRRIANKLDNLTFVIDKLKYQLVEERELATLQLAEFRNELLTFPEKVA